MRKIAKTPFFQQRQSLFSIKVQQTGMRQRPLRSIRVCCNPKIPRLHTDATKLCFGIGCVFSSNWLLSCSILGLPNASLKPRKNNMPATLAYLRTADSAHLDAVNLPTSSGGKWKERPVKQQRVNDDFASKALAPEKFKHCRASQDGQSARAHLNRGFS